MWYIISHFQVWRWKFFLHYCIILLTCDNCILREEQANAPSRKIHVLSCKCDWLLVTMSHHASTQEGCLCCTCKSFSKRFASWHCMTCIIGVRGILYPQELQIENTPSKRLNSFLGLLRYSSFITLQWGVSSMWRIKAIMGWWMLSENVTVNRSKTDKNSLTY